MGCRAVCRDNPQALASGLSCVLVDKHGITILYHIQEVFHVYLNKFENAAVYFLLYLVIIDFHGLF